MCRSGLIACKVQGRIFTVEMSGLAEKPVGEALTSRKPGTAPRGVRVERLGGRQVFAIDRLRRIGSEVGPGSSATPVDNLEVRRYTS